MPTVAELLALRRAKQAEQAVDSQQAVQQAVDLSPNPSPLPSAGSAPVPVSFEIPIEETSPEVIPKWATKMKDELQEMADKQDFADVEASAGALAEMLNVILQLPYTPDVFVDECIEHAASALHNQKRVYMQRVLSGEKQSGSRNKNKQIAVALTIDLENDEDVLG